MSLGKDLVFLILQFCDEENLKKTAHALEQETGYFFDLKHFEELGLNGKWDEAEKYLSSFTVLEDNKYSTKIYFEIRKQKYLEALDNHEFSRALDILKTDLHVFAKSNKDLYKEMAHLLALDDFRENDSLAPYGDTLSARKSVLGELRAVIEANPLLQGRTRFPQINKSRLRRLINQSLNWQHIHCTHPHPQPHIDTLFTDHKCPGPDNMQEQLNKDSSLPPTSVAVAVSASPLSRNSTSNRSLATDAVVTATSVNIGNLSDQALGEDKSYHDVKTTELTDKEESSADISTHYQASENEVPIDFPKKVERVLNISSPVTTMDFHPVHENLLLVGKTSGYVEIWDVAALEKLFERECKVKEAILIEKLDKPSMSVNRVLWSSDGSLFGVAYSKRQLHLYNKNGNSFEIQWEIDAHVGSVNDLAFSKPKPCYKHLVISCGDDKLIHVWDAATGAKQYTVEGHREPVYSLCASVKENIHFVFSISICGNIRTWLFHNNGPRIDYDAPGFCRTRMAYGAGYNRLFSGGTNKNGDSYIVEWNEAEGCILRNYQGLSKCSSDVVQFDTWIKFLAAGDEHSIKIWDMDSSDLLAVIDADGGLLASPHIRFSKKGNLLAVSAEDNQIKILANDHGRQFLQESAFAFDDSSSGSLRESFSKLSVETPPFPCQGVLGGNGAASKEILDVLWNSKPKETEEATAYMEMPSIPKIVEVHSCHSLLLVSEATDSLIKRLVYTHAGNGILALAVDGKHLLWRWAKSDSNLNGQATTDFEPQLWQPRRGSLMVNERSDCVTGIATPCLSLSKNDSYLISASGWMISLYNVLASKKMRNVMPPPPAATCLMFYPPDNNIVVIGMDDSTVLVYNIRVDEVISKLEGHSKRISGLAFSTKHQVLVSCGVDTQIVVWDCTTWEKKKSTVLQISVEWFDSDFNETHVELDKHEDHFLAVHETQLAIYETATLRRVKQWTMANFCARISHATYSCDSQVVYAAMKDNILLILSARDLTPLYEIDPSAYLPTRIRPCVKVVVVAAHPHKPKQFALGLSSGGVVVIEPHQSYQGEWAIKKLCY